MSKTLAEVAEFVGRACGTIVKDLGDVSQPLAEAFGRGWRQAMNPEPPGAQPEPSRGPATDPA